MRIRLRRLRQNGTIRSMVRENRVNVDDLILPIFVAEGKGIKNPVLSMPGVFQYSPDMLPEIMDQVASAGIPGVLLFGIPACKDETGSASRDDHNCVCQAIRLIRKRYPSVTAIADICLCEYTSHGHCGIVKDGKILNDETLEYLAQMALATARAGCHMVAPSDMMDGRVGYIRDRLDEEGFADVMIMAYSAKFASSYYGPFREAAGSAPQFGDRRSYQMDPADGRQAIREMRQDADEGADIIMVKPALAYLDLVKEAKERFLLPVATYNVSGEYAMVKAASDLGYVSEKKIVMENMASMKRAGADIIITYHALDVAKWLKEPF
ncbi:MAG: porphobilinogen synthase [Succinivibrionaceae bacterium]|nr:porphobilinogen synthase [Succinivibrionaceae bacterium]